MLPIHVPANEAFPEGQVCWRPLVLAHLTALNGRKLSCVAWLDSGADHCCLPASFAAELGLDLLTMKKTICSGVGGQTTLAFANLEIDIGNGIRFSAYVGFTPGLEEQSLALFGQHGFFDKHRVEFDHRNRRFFIEPFSTQPS